MAFLRRVLEIWWPFLWAWLRIYALAVLMYLGLLQVSDHLTGILTGALILAVVVAIPCIFAVLLEDEDHERE